MRWCVGGRGEGVVRLGRGREGREVVGVGVGGGLEVRFRVKMSAREMLRRCEGVGLR